MVKLLSSLLKVEASLTQKNEQKGSFTQDKHNFLNFLCFITINCEIEYVYPFFSVQSKVLEFELTTFGTWVSSHNH